MIGRTFLYKDGKAEIFQGEEVTKKLAEGWFDNPSETPTAESDPQKEKEEEIKSDDAASGAVTQENKDKDSASAASTFKQKPLKQKSSRKL